MPQDVHDQLARIPAGNLELVAAVDLESSYLLRMLTLIRDPAGSFWRESQHSGFRAFEADVISSRGTGVRRPRSPDGFWLRLGPR